MSPKTLIGLFCLGATACSVDSINDKDLSPEAKQGKDDHGNDSRIFGRYDVTYEAETRQARAFAVLRVGGSTGTGLRLTEENRIELDGKSLTMTDGDSARLKLYTTHYSLNLPADDWKPEYSFTWFIDGKQRHNSVKMLSVTLSAENLQVAVKRGDELQFRWLGNDTKEDQVRLWLWHDSYSQDAAPATGSSENTGALQNSPPPSSPQTPNEDLELRYELVDSKADKTFSIDAAKTKRFKTGTWKLKAYRTWRATPTEGHGAGGLLTSTYNDRTYRFEVKE